jgi:hypothetical protein
MAQPKPGGVDMYTAERLEQMRNVDITIVDRMSLTNLETINVDDTVSYKEKVIQFLEQVRNPYAFRVGDIPVKVTFASDAPMLKETLSSYLTSLQAGQ